MFEFNGANKTQNPQNVGPKHGELVLTNTRVYEEEKQNKMKGIIKNYRSIHVHNFFKKNV